MSVGEMVRECRSEKWLGNRSRTKAQVILTILSFVMLIRKIYI